MTSQTSSCFCYEISISGLYYWIYIQRYIIFCTIMKFKKVYTTKLTQSIYLFDRKNNLQYSKKSQVQKTQKVKNKTILCVYFFIEEVNYYNTCYNYNISKKNYQQLSQHYNWNFKNQMSKEKKICYYQILGCSKTSTPDQIKKAYKKLAIKWHPDKNPDNKQAAKQKFRQIAQAYQFLSDAQKRRVYDKYGHDGPQTTSFHQNFHFSDANNIFKHFFKDNPFDNDDDDDFFSSIFGKKKGNRSQKGAGFGGGSFRGFGMGPSLFRSQSLFQHDDDFFKGGFGSGFGGQSHFSSFKSSSFGGDGGLDSHPGLTKSVSTTTETVNGKTVTSKKTTIVNQDGSKQVTEQVIDGGVKMQKKYSLGPGESSKQNAVKY